MGIAGGPNDPDITVLRCTARVRRRDGWAWGDPQEHVDRIRSALERALVQAATHAGLADGDDAVVREPVVLRVGPDGSVHPDDSRALARAIRDAVVAPHSRPSPSTAGSPSSLPPQPPPRHRVGGARPVSVDPARVAAALAGWSRAGRLVVVVAGWTAAAHSAWLQALRNPVAAELTAHLADASVARIADAVLTRPGSETASTAEARALVLAGAVVAAADGRVPDRATLDAVLRVAGAGLHDGALPEPTDGRGAARPYPVAPAPGGRPDGSDPARPVEPVAPPPEAGPWVVPALPFLVLVQLGRLGYLEGAGSALAVCGLDRPDAVLAAMLAGKVLPPPQHGWLRTPPERDAVRLLSGLDEDDVLAELADREPTVHDALGPLASVLVGLHAADRSRFAEVALTRTTEDGTVIGEPEHGVPIAWASEPAELASVLAQLGDPPVLEGSRFTDLVDRLAPRRAVPGMTVEGLERVLGAAVGTGLASLAEDLWDGAADPLLALDRLGDLEARVDLGERTTIGIPRGQRWLDLKRAGLVDAWPASWAPGGVWEVVTW